MYRLSLQGELGITQSIRVPVGDSHNDDKLMFVIGVDVSLRFVDNLLSSANVTQFGATAFLTNRFTQDAVLLATTGHAPSIIYDDFGTPSPLLAIDR